MSDYTVDKICRTCLVETEDLRSLHREGKICGEVTTLSEMLSECTSLEINDEDHLPQHICSKCMLSLSKAYFFRRTCINADSELRERQKTAQLDYEEVPSTVYFYDIQETDEILEEVSSEQEQTYEYETERESKFAAESNSASDGVTYATKMESNEANTSQDEEYPNEETIDTYTVEIEEGMCEESTGETESDLQLTKVMKKRNVNTTRVGNSFKCDQCGKLLSTYSSYKYHIQLHSDKTPFICNHCGEGFKTRNAYDGHLTTHDTNNPNKCKICGKAYRQAASLRSHMLNHTGEKPYKCDICGKGMTQKSGYKKHMLTHTGEKPHECDICGLSFRFSSNMITHRRRHTGEKPYACTTCSKAFVSSEQLKRHLSVHTGERLYRCHLCDKAYSRKATLRIHFTERHPSDNNECPICGKEFKSPEILFDHVSNHKEHGNDDSAAELEINEHSDLEQDNEKEAEENEEMAES